MTHHVSASINGDQTDKDVDPRLSLGDFLRDDCGLTGTHLGCEHGVCGACTVLVDDAPVRSCIFYAVQADGLKVRTIEGFDDDDIMRRLRIAFSEHHALQCGFCTAGMLITGRDIIRRLGPVDEERIREELAGNLCRCTGYVGIVRAIQQVASENIVKPSRPRSKPFENGPKAILLSPKVKASRPSFAPATTGGSAITVEKQFETPHSPDEVWRFFADPNAIASCLPGAELLSVDGENLRGRVQIKMGPIKAQFTGDVRYLRDDESRVGSVEGSGIDSISNSRVNGALGFRLNERTPEGTRVDLSLSFTLQGLLAQFSRPPLVRDFVGFIVGQFALNLNAALAGNGKVVPAKSLTFWTMANWWLRRLFRSGS